MNREQKIKFLQKNLLIWYKTNRRKFPWRNKSINIYQKVIAEVLLQRTKAETVAKFYPQFIKDFPNWKSLADTNVKKVEKYLIPVGLYRQRSALLKNLADEMVKRNGRLPRNRKELESIPFMGQYIANSVELVVFNQPSPLIDVNMARVLERFFGPRILTDIRYDSYLQNLSYKLVGHKNSKDVNWAVLDFSSAVCVARNPRCVICHLKKYCKFYNSNIYKITNGN
jgi:A/G-specific adenine glycosylase